MFKYFAVVFAVIACTFAKPSVFAPIALNAAPVALAAPVVTTGTSSQYQVTNHNIATPVVASAPLVAAPAAYAAAPLAYATAPAAYAAAPLAYASPLNSAYTYSSSWNSPYAAAYYV